MTDKELLLSKLCDDNTICYRMDLQGLQIRNQKNEYIAHWSLNTKIFWVSYHRIWVDFKSKIGDNTQEIMDLTSPILEDHLKRKGITTGKW